MTPTKIAERKDIPDDHKWDLTALFISDADWDTLFDEVENQIDIYADYKGRLKDSINVLQDLDQFDAQLIRECKVNHGMSPTWNSFTTSRSRGTHCDVTFWLCLNARFCSTC